MQIDAASITQFAEVYVLLLHTSGLQWFAAPQISQHVKVFSKPC